MKNKLKQVKRRGTVGAFTGHRQAGGSSVPLPSRKAKDKAGEGPLPPNQIRELVDAAPVTKGWQGISARVSDATEDHAKQEWAADELR